MLTDLTMNAHPWVLVEEAVTTTAARARLVVKAVAELGRSTARTRTRIQVLAGREKVPGEGRSRISPRGLLIIINY